MVHQPSPPSPEKSRGCCVYRKAILEKIFLETWPTRVLLFFIWLLQLHFSCLRIYDLQLIFLTTEILSCTLCSISCLPFFSSKNWPNTHHILYRHASAVCSLRRMPASILRFFFSTLQLGLFHKTPFVTLISPLNSVFPIPLLTSPFTYTITLFFG